MLNFLIAQNNRQNIRGAIVDKLSQTPLIGANVQIINREEKKRNGYRFKGELSYHQCFSR